VPLGCAISLDSGRPGTYGLGAEAEEQVVDSRRPGVVREVDRPAAVAVAERSVLARG
jgi:hypothetical protein